MYKYLDWKLTIADCLTATPRRSAFCRIIKILYLDILDHVSLAWLSSVNMSAPILGSSSSNEKSVSKEQAVSNPPTSDSDSEIQDVTPEYGSYHHHVFASPAVAEHWRQMYEKAHYEGRHRFDPLFTWSADEEKRVRRKVGTHW